MFLVLLLETMLFPDLLTSQKPEIQRNQRHTNPHRSIIVPENVASVVRPLLDLRQESISQCGIPGTPSKCIDGQAYTEERAREEKFNRLLERLITQQGPSIDEGLVVLMCFYVGESGEEVDSVISRGRRMIPYLQKYGNRIPAIPNRYYASSMLNDAGITQEQFRGAMLAIKQSTGGR